MRSAASPSGSHRGARGACLVLAVVALVVAACGGGPRGAAGPPADPRRIALALGEARARYEVEVQTAGVRSRGIADLVVSPSSRGELLATLTVREVDLGLGPLAGLAGISFRWRMTTAGDIVAAGGPSGPVWTPTTSLQRALAVWPLIAAAVPNVPDGELREGAAWDATQFTQVVGGGQERTVSVSGRWRLAKVFVEAPRTVVLEGELTIEVRDPTLPGDAGEKDVQRLPARAAVYINLERRAVDFVTVSAGALSWQARRL